MLERLKVFRLGSALLIAALVGCSNGGDDPAPAPVPVPGVTYTVGGTVSGLASTGLVLQNNNASDLAVGANGAFTFAAPMAVGASYSVTVKTQPSGQTCSVGNGSGTSAGANVNNVTVICSTSTHTVGGTVSGLIRLGLVLQNNNASDLTVAADGAFTSATPVAVGASYSVTVKTQPLGQTCTVGNGSGTSTGANVTNVTVTCSTTKHFAYVLTGARVTISAFTVNANTGELTATGLYGSGLGPSSMAFHPTGKFAYVTNFTDNSVTAYAINANTGSLPAIESVSAGANTTCDAFDNCVSVAAGPISIAVEPTGKFVYVANYTTNTVSAYAINASTGALTAIGSPVPAGGANPNFIAIDPTGKFAYVANNMPNGIGSVSVYAINANTGALTAIGSPVPAGGPNPSSIAIHPTGKFAYVANGYANNVSVYAINANTGELTAIGSPVPAGSDPSSIAIDPAGKFAYVANLGSSNVSAFAINANTGALTVVGSPVPSDMDPSTIAIDPTGKFAYTANTSVNTISTYAINAKTGELTSTGPPVPTGTGYPMFSPLFIAIF